MNKDFVGIPAARKATSGPVVYRRVVRIVAPEEGVVLGDLADDPHHFRVRLQHDGRRVTDIVGESLRFPWTTCPGASEPLRALIGMPLSRDAMAAGEHTDSLQNCTHMFDLAGLCIAVAASADTSRRYDCDVASIDGETYEDGNSGRSRARVARDGVPALEWEVRAQTIESPDRYAGVHLFRQFTKWTRENLPPEEAEAALVLRRACFVSPTRFFDLDLIGTAAELNSTKAVCHSFQPARVFEARRMKGMQCDFSAHPDDLIEVSDEIAKALRADRS